MKIPSIDFNAEYFSLKKPINQAIQRVLRSGWFLMGKELENFEKELGRYLGVKNVVGVSSGTDALTIALKSLGLGPHDEVIVPANVYPTVFGVSLAGVKIRLCDVDEKSLNISLKNIKKVWNFKVKAIVVVHLYGNPVDLEPIKKFCTDKKIYLIEDCAQSIGTEYKGQKVGGIGEIGCFSFYPTKNLGAYGDGGAVVTNNKALADKFKLWRMYGEVSRYQSVLPGLNSRLNEIQAAILRIKLPFLDKWNKKRVKIAEAYKDKLKDLPIKFIQEVNGGKNIYHLMVIRSEKRNQLLNFLQKKGIGVSIHYPFPIHLTKSFSYLGKKNDFPVAERASREVLSLPIYPMLNEKEVMYIIEKVKEFFNS